MEIKSIIKENKYRIVFFSALVVSATATAGSLYYSEVMGFYPCKLCWFQRIVTYPQVLVFSLGLLMSWKDGFNPFTTYVYGLSLSSIGTVIATYQSYIQLGASHSSEGFCTEACSAVLYKAFGVFTIPNQSLIANVLILVICVIGVLLYRR